MTGLSGKGKPKSHQFNTLCAVMRVVSLILVLAQFVYSDCNWLATLTATQNASLASLDKALCEKEKKL